MEYRSISSNCKSYKLSISGTGKITNKSISIVLFLKEARSFSIIFRSSKYHHKSIDLVAESSNCRQIWIRVLEHLIETQKHGRRTFNEERWLIDQFNKTDRDHTGSLNFDELWKLFNRLNLEVSEQYCRSIFKVSLYIYLHNYI
jgi:hypothetical protein